MNATNNTTNEKLTEQLAKLDWQIEDAKRDLANAAKQLARRAEEATTQCDAMLADQPCSLGWVDFAEGDLRRAAELKTRLNQLLEQKNFLTFIAKN